MRPHRAVSGAAAEAARVARGATDTHRHLRDRLVAILLVSVTVDLVCAVLGYLAEHHAHQTQISTFGSALFWTTTQLLTVSSNLMNPISAGGRVLDVFMEAYAVTVVASLAGSFGAFFHRRGNEREGTEQRAAAHAGR
jgi:hypothetical protein